VLQTFASLIESLASIAALPTIAEATPAFIVVSRTSTLLIEEQKLEAIPPATNAAVSAIVEISEEETRASATETFSLPAAMPEISDTPLIIDPSTDADLIAVLPSARPTAPPTYSAPLSLTFLISEFSKAPSTEA